MTLFLFISTQYVIISMYSAVYLPCNTVVSCCILKVCFVFVKVKQTCMFERLLMRCYSKLLKRLQPCIIFRRESTQNLQKFLEKRCNFRLLRVNGSFYLVDGQGPKQLMIAKILKCSYIIQEICLQVIEKEFITLNCIVSTIFRFIELCRAI